MTTAMAERPAFDTDGDNAGPFKQSQNMLESFQKEDRRGSFSTDGIVYQSARTIGVYKLK